MYLNKNILIVIPARGGSKGVPLKNIHPLGGKPLINWTLDFVKELNIDVRTFISTDSREIAKVVESENFEVPFLRPKEISGDKATDIQVLEHAIKEIEKYDAKQYDIVLLLQPTCPFRKKEYIVNVLELIINGNYDSVWTVNETDLKFHPTKQLLLDKGLLKYILQEGNKIPVRQDLSPTYHVNGVAYALTRDCILNLNSRMGNKSAPLIIKDKLINIDTYDDFLLAEKYLNNEI